MGRGPWLWLGGYALASFFAFPQLIAGVVVDLGAAVSWLAPACLWMGLRGASPRQAAKRAFLASLVAHSAIVHWIWIVTVVYGHANPWLGVLGPLGIGVYVAGFAAAYAAVAAAGRLESPWLLAALWTALEHLRSFALGGFPWATLGYSQHLNPALLGLAPWTAVYGLSFVTFLGGVALAQATGEWRGAGRLRAATCGALAGVVAFHLLGFASGALTPSDPGQSVRVAVLQGNIDQGAKWSREGFERALSSYEGLTREASAAGAQVVVWPETAVPGAIGSDPRQAGRLEALAEETGALLVIGAVGLEAGPAGHRSVFDSAFAIDPRAGLVARYDKSHLVPFGEYVPLAELFGSFFEAVARGIADTAVTQGPGPRALVLSAGGTSLTVGLPICYELLFPDLVRRFVNDGGALLLAITNDAWYGRTGAPYQFLAMTALRSAETRVWTARAANTGVSAIIDARGRVQQRTRIFERDWLQADVPIRSAPAGGSFYTRYGDVFAWSCWAVSALGVWQSHRRRGRGERDVR
ncbi:MAG: apolipoprotein N-acyltransferase [Deltaproteobacteria bacterium]|nr:apolipoprotein N-acyltransferase [Deltaproteobacteria bacterium]